MSSNYPEVDVDILIIRNNKLLLGLLTNKWNYKGHQVYGLPGREIKKGETIGEAVKRLKFANEVQHLQGIIGSLKEVHI